MNGKSPPSDATPLERAELVRQQMLSAPDDEVTGQVDVSKSGFHARGVPQWAIGAAMVILAIGAVVYLVLKLR